MEEIKNTKTEVQPTIQSPVKKTRYWLWFGLTFALIMGVGFFLLYSPHLRESGTGSQIFFKVLLGISHIFYITDGLEEKGWIQMTMFFLVLMSQKIPFVPLIYVFLPIVIYFIIGALFGKIYGKSKENPTVFAIFLLIIVCFVGYRLFTFQQKYYPSGTSDCMIYSNEFEQGACISEIARNKKDIEMCKDVPKGSNYEKECYSMVAVEVREYGVCDKMPFGEEYSYPHKTACRDDIASIRSECEQISTQEGQDVCYLHTSQSIQQYAKQNACQRFKEVIGLKHLIQKCEDFKSGKITIVEICEKIKDENIKNQCVQSPAIGTIMFGPEKTEPVEGLYGPGTPETEEEIKNRPKPIDENTKISEENLIVTTAEQDEEIIFTEPSCKDMDDGITASKKGIIIMNNGKYFEDVCTIKTGELYKTVTSCTGNDCYIEEGYCFAETTTPESLPTNIVPCPNGCNNGICKINNTKEGTYTTFCNNIVRENDPEYQVWKDIIEKQFPELYVNIMGAYCKINNGNTVVSFSYSSSSGENKQRIVLFNRRGQYIKFTDKLDCRFDSGNYFRFQNESNGIISMFCENNFIRGNPNGVQEKIISSTFYTLNLSTLEAELTAEK